jgi:hypothetical protein
MATRFLLLITLLLMACARPADERVLAEQATPGPAPSAPASALPTPVSRSAATSPAAETLAQVAVEGIAAQASGAGEIAVGRFADNPATPIGFATAGFFRVSTTPGSAFGLVTVMRCQVAGGLVYWWDGLDWSLASQQAFDKEGGCVTVGITGATAPSLTQLSGPGVAFALGEPPRVNAVEPAAGRPGAATTITGLNFGGATGVSFGTTASPTFRIESEQTIVAEAPSQDGTVEVIVTTPAGSSAIGGPQFTFQ